jgi:chromosomal replication initiation ATPase DnaA
MAKDILKDIIVDKSREINIELIQKTVADHYKIKTVRYEVRKKAEKHSSFLGKWPFTLQGTD